MNSFEGRKAVANEILCDFLNTMAPPRGVDPQGLALIIANISDAFARKMPIKGDFRQAVSDVLVKLRDTHQSHSWPPQAAFVLAMPKGDAMSRGAAESFKVDDPVAHYAQLMSEGEAVPEAALWGIVASELPRRELERYRSASVMNWVEGYRDFAPKAMRARYGHVVDPYFSQTATR